MTRKENPEHAPALRAFARLLSKVPPEHVGAIERFAKAARPATAALALVRIAERVEEKSTGDVKRVKLAVDRAVKAEETKRDVELRFAARRERVEWLFGKVLKEEIDLSLAMYATVDEFHEVHGMRLGFRPASARTVVEILARCANRRDAGAEPLAEYEEFAAFWREAFVVCGGE